MADKPRFWRLILFASTHSQCDVTTCDSRSKYSHLRSSNSLLLAVTRKALTRGRTLVTFSSCDLEFRSMTLTSEGDLESVKLNQQAKYVGHRSSSSKYIVRICRHTQTRPIALPEPLKWSATNDAPVGTHHAGNSCACNPTQSLKMFKRQKVCTCGACPKDSLVEPSEGMNPSVNRLASFSWKWLSKRM